MQMPNIFAIDKCVEICIYYHILYNHVRNVAKNVFKNVIVMPSIIWKLSRIYELEQLMNAPHVNRKLFKHNCKQYVYIVYTIHI